MSLEKLRFVASLPCLFGEDQLVRPSRGYVKRVSPADFFLTVGGTRPIANQAVRTKLPAHPHALTEDAPVGSGECPSAKVSVMTEDAAITEPVSE